MSAYFGDNDAAIRKLTTALHLMPFEPMRHLGFIGMGCAHFGADGMTERYFGCRVDSRLPLDLFGRKGLRWPPLR